MGIDKVSFPKGPTNVELADLVRDACDKGLERQLILSSDVARRTMLSRYGGKRLSDGAAGFRADAGGARHSRATIETMLSRQSGEDADARELTGLTATLPWPDHRAR